MTNPNSASEVATHSGTDGPLVVDLDGTLIRGDLLWEAILGLLGREPWVLLLLPFWLLGGRARFKTRIAQRYVPGASDLPYRTEVLDHCRRARSAGRPVLLASASPSPWVLPVAAHVGLFDTVLASEANDNLKGARKLVRILEETGNRPFAYMGDSRADGPIWEAAEEAIGVACTRGASRILERHPNARTIEDDKGSPLRAAFAALRPRQWAKNALVFAPILLAHKLNEPAMIWSGLLAFALFCSVASAGYIANDLLDMGSDRSHPTKRRRPIAAGDLPVPAAIGIAAGLILIAGGISAAWGRPGVGPMLAAYLTATLAYSLYFKRTLLLDVLILAALYTLRILTGGVAAGVSVSPWLLAFSAFFFLSLALVKRYLELRRARSDNHQQLERRAYRTDDIGLVETLGLACGLVSVLVLCLFVSSADVSLLYRSPELLWLMCPVMLYWIARIWFLARRGQIDDDPVLFATRDPSSYLAGALVLATVAAAATW